MDALKNFFYEFKSETLLNKLDTRLTLGLTFIGGAYSLSKLYLPIRGLWRSFLRPERNLLKRYNGGWAIVTGASDGVGKEYAMQLAKRGFNIVLIARNKEKLEGVALEVLQQNPSITTKIIVFDFSVNFSGVSYGPLFDELRQIEDISILVNNVGIGKVQPYHEMKLQEIASMVNVNCIPLVMLTREVLPSML